MASYAIGDIQGCFDSLQRLLDRLHFDPTADTLWFTGDLVNRGPQSLETLRFVKALGEQAITVLGNHDLHLIAVHQGHRQFISKGDTLDGVLQAQDGAELIHWLRRQPLLHHDEGLGYTMVHAGLPPQWDLPQARACARELEEVLGGEHYRDFIAHMYGNLPERWDDDLHGTDRLRFIVNCFTRLRYCNANGKLALSAKGRPGTQPAGTMPWFQVPTRRSREHTILFGHWSTLGLYRQDNVIALDTGCLWGGKLTALRLEDGETISVNCPETQSPGVA